MSDERKDINETGEGYEAKSPQHIKIKGGGGLSGTTVEINGHPVRVRRIEIIMVAGGSQNIVRFDVAGDIELDIYA